MPCEILRFFTFRFAFIQGKPKNRIFQKALVSFCVTLSSPENRFFNYLMRFDLFSAYDFLKQAWTTLNFKERVDFLENGIRSSYELLAVWKTHLSYAVFPLTKVILKTLGCVFRKLYCLHETPGFFSVLISHSVRRILKITLKRRILRCRIITTSSFFLILFQ